VQEAEGALEWHRESAGEVARDFENREDLASAEMGMMRARQRR